ncbi:MAG: hypothetical protein JWM57_4226, partial [Phycisphaerales bacterium]|nr:hypothetical protein [Phycisphaerales bacterium]
MMSSSDNLAPVPWTSRLATPFREADWSQRRFLGGLALLPAVGLSLAFGAWRGDEAAGVRAAGGAVAVGFGAFHRLAKYRTLPLGLTLIAMAVSTFVGAISHRGGWPADVVVALFWGWVFGLVTTLGWGAWWIGLQAIVALLAFGSIPADIPEAAWHGVMVITGGVMQMAALRGVWRLNRLPDAPDEAIPDAWWSTLVKNASPNTAGGRHALRVSVALGVGVLLHHFVALTHGYWVPMTAAILLKPEFHETAIRGIARLSGTLVGAAVATLIASFLHPGPLALGLCLLLAIWACFALQRVNYALYAIFI